MIGWLIITNRNSPTTYHSLRHRTFSAACSPWQKEATSLLYPPTHNTPKNGLRFQASLTIMADAGAAAWVDVDPTEIQLLVALTWVCMQIKMFHRTVTEIKVQEVQTTRKRFSWPAVYTQTVLYSSGCSTFLFGSVHWRASVAAQPDHDQRPKSSALMGVRIMLVHV